MNNISLKENLYFLGKKKNNNQDSLTRSYPVEKTSIGPQLTWAGFLLSPRMHRSVWILPAGAP